MSSESMKNKKYFHFSMPSPARCYFSLHIARSGYFPYNSDSYINVVNIFFPLFLSIFSLLHSQPAVYSITRVFKYQRLISGPCIYT